MKFGKFLLIVVILLLSGCATPPAIIDLKPPQTELEPIILSSKTCTFIKGTSAFMGDANICLLPGVYRLYKENKVGRFYLSDLPSIYWKQGDTFICTRGGIWMPSDAASLPRVFQQIRGAPIKGKTIEEIEEVRSQLTSKIVAAGSDLPTLITTGLSHSPVVLNPVQAGIAGGIVGAIDAVLIPSDGFVPHIYDEPNTPEFIELIRNSISQ